MVHFRLGRVPQPESHTRPLADQILVEQPPLQFLVLREMSLR